MLCIAARAQTAKSPTNHGADSDIRLINFGTKVLSDIVSKIPFNTKTSAPIP